VSESEWDDQEEAESEGEDDGEVCSDFEGDASDFECQSEGEEEVEEAEVEERPVRKRSPPSKLPGKGRVPPKPPAAPKGKRSAAVTPSDAIVGVGKKKGKAATAAASSKSAGPGPGPKGGKGKNDVLRGVKKGKVEKGEKVQPPKIITESNSNIRDMSGPALKLCKDKFLLGSNHTVQVGSVNFSGTRSYSYDALIFSREPRPLKDGEEETEGEPRKAFRFNMPATCLTPLRNALTAILQRSGREAINAHARAAVTMETDE
jgi:hypothetical protein